MVYYEKKKILPTIIVKIIQLFGTFAVQLPSDFLNVIAIGIHTHVHKTIF